MFFCCYLRQSCLIFYGKRNKQMRMRENKLKFILNVCVMKHKKLLLTVLWETEERERRPSEHMFNILLRRKSRRSFPSASQLARTSRKFTLNTVALITHSRGITKLNQPMLDSIKFRSQTLVRGKYKINNEISLNSRTEMFNHNKKSG